MSSDKKNPLVQVVRKSAATLTPTVKPTGLSVTPKPSSFSRIRPVSSAMSSSLTPLSPIAPRSPSIISREMPRFAPRAKPRGAPPTREEILALAIKERVPNRIAKGELDGKMKCRIWKKLHAEEAKRFDQAYALIDVTPGLELVDAFALSQSGMSTDELAARRGRAKRRETIKAARNSTDSGAVDEFFSKLVKKKVEVCVTLAERSVLDVVTKVLPVAIEFERSGSIDKLQMVAIASRDDWESISAQVTRESRLAQKPTPVSRLPEKRPYSDPMVFAGSVGLKIHLTLRNGLKFDGILHALGGFDLLLKVLKKTVLVPIHAVVSWAPAAI